MGFFVLIVIGAIIFFAVKSGQASQEQWKMAAERLHLTFTPSEGFGYSGAIQGGMNGHRVAVSVFTKGSGNSSSSYTRYRLDYRHPVRVDMKITRQGMLQGIGKAMGMQDIEVGNPAFDDYLIVKGSNPDAVRDFLSIKIQSDIRDLAMTYLNVTITGSYVEIDKSGKESDAGVITRTVRRLAGFCEAMMEASENKSGEVPRPPDVAEEPPAMPIIDIEPPKIPFDSPGTADPVVPEPPAIPDLPDAPEFPEATGTEMLTEIEALKNPDDPIDVPDEGPLELEETARQLFGDSGGSLLVNSKFDEQCKGRMIAGSGELVRVSRISYDPVFNETKGAKAVISVCELKGTYSKIKVVAEIMYPREEYEQLNARIGAKLPISGTLIAQDTMMNRLFIIAAPSNHIAVG